jgi:hypothetical protein
MTTKPAPATNTPATDLPRKVVAFAPAACTLPTAERPLRASEFVDLLGTQVIATHLVNNQHTRFELAPLPEVAARAADLFAREARCCSFFTFTLTAAAGLLTLDVQVPSSQVGVLAALSGLAGPATEQ